MPTRTLFKIRQAGCWASAGMLPAGPFCAAEDSVVDFDAAVADAVRAQADALFVLPGPLTLLERRRITDLATKQRLPAMYGFKEFVGAGG